MKVKKLKKVFIVTSIIANAICVNAANYFVDIDSKGGTANDNNQGTINSPWKTLTRALNKKHSTLQAGDTVYLREGKYKGIKVTVSGSVNAPIIIKAWKKEKVVITTKNMNVVNINAENLEISGLILKGSGSKGVACLISNSKNIVLKQMDISNSRIGVWTNNSVNLQLLNSDIHHCAFNVFIGEKSRFVRVVANEIHHAAPRDGVTVYAAGSFVCGKKTVDDVKILKNKRAVIIAKNAAFNKMRNGTIYGTGSKKKAKTVSLALLFKEGYGKGVINGGTVKEADNRVWFKLCNNPDWGDKPYSPDGKQLLIETGSARPEELKLAKFIYVAYCFDPARRCKDIIIADNHIYECARQGVRTQVVRNILIKNNKIHNNGATGIQLESGTDMAWVENNEIYANSNKYRFETGLWVHETTNTVIQNNKISKNQIGIAVSQSYNCIVRRNIIFDNKAQFVTNKPDLLKKHIRNFYISGGRDCKIVQAPGASDNSFVHNTMYNNGLPSTINAGMTFNFSSSPVIGRNLILNNLQQKQYGKTTLQLVRFNGLVLNGNIYDNMNAAQILCNKKKYDFNASGFKRYQDATGLDKASRIGKVVLAKDYTPKKNSKAIDTAVSLALTVSSGKGLKLELSDISSFSAGFKLSNGKQFIQGDEIMISGKRARIKAIDKKLKVITLDRSVSWEIGSPVCYVYSGKASDVGAVESR